MSHSSFDGFDCQRGYPHAPPHQNFDAGLLWTYPDDDAPATMPPVLVAGVVMPTTGADLTSNTTTSSPPLDSKQIKVIQLRLAAETGLLG